MMSDMKTKTLVLILSLLVVGIFLVVSLSPFSSGSTQKHNNATDQDSSKYVGDISTSTSGMMLYRNNQLGLAFEYPQGWRVSSNSLGYGMLQLFSYDVANADGKSVFPKGDNKIEAVIVNDPIITTSSDYPEKSRETTPVSVVGQRADKTTVTLQGGEKSLIYIIPLPSQSGKFLRIVIYGDPANFSILDDLVQSIQWVQ